MNFLPSLLILPILLILSGSQAFGQQQMTMGQTPNEKIAVIIDETGTAHVTHKVMGPSQSPIQVDMINGNITNFTVTDVNGGSVEYGNIQKIPMSIILNTSQRNMTLIKYDLVNVVSNTDGVWKWNYYEPQKIDFTEFHFPKGVDMIWANDRPVYLGELGLGQHGNGFTLKYIINEPAIVQNVKLEDRNFEVVVKTVSGVGDYVFDQSQKTYAFNVDKANVPVTVIIPNDFLSGPFDVTIDGTKTLHQVFHKNETHSWIGLLPAKSGTVRITGTNMSQVQNTTTDQGPQTSNSTPSPSDNSMIIPIAIGIIVAGVVGFIISKKRKTQK